MAVDHIRYDILAQDALRGVVRRLLMDTAENGLPGEHHFYISFDTRAEGVRLSPRMRAQYPEEMTVVLQHQFWDLKVTETGFEVGVSFGGIPERVSVPFAEEAPQPEENTAAASESIRAPSEHKAIAPTIAPVPVAANTEPAKTTSHPEAEKPATGEVVQLDRFRKK